MIVPVIVGCSEQKYLYSPGRVNATAYDAFVSSTEDGANAELMLWMRCGTSSSLVHETRSPDAI